MSKFAWLVILVLISGSLLTGIVELKVNKEKFFTLPDITTAVVQEKSTYEQGRAFAVSLKRKAEQLVIRNKERRLVLGLLYVTSDSKRLQELIDKGTAGENYDFFLPQSKLLIDSISLVRSTAESAPISVVADLKQDSREAFLQAQRTLRNLQVSNSEYQDINNEFSRLTQSLEESIGGLNLDGEPTGAVAGTSDASNAPGAENQSSPAPLKF